MMYDNNGFPSVCPCVFLLRAAATGGVVGEKRKRELTMTDAEREKREALRRKKEEQIAAAKEIRLQQRKELGLL